MTSTSTNLSLDMGQEDLAFCMRFMDLHELNIALGRPIRIRWLRRKRSRSLSAQLTLLTAILSRVGHKNVRTVTSAFPVLCEIGEQLFKA